MDDAPWYQQLRNRYRPEEVRFLLVGESVPDARGIERRFFYSEQLTRHDNLFRGVALAQYGLDGRALQSTPKVEVLHRLRSDGFWLIDAVSFPVNHLGSRERQRAVAASVPSIIERVRSISPGAGVFICTAPIYRLAATQLRGAGVALLNTGPAPFPLGNTRSEFVRCWRRDIHGPNADAVRWINGDALDPRARLEDPG